jgi:hypothetical protein
MSSGDAHKTVIGDKIPVWIYSISRVPPFVEQTFGRVARSCQSKIKARASGDPFAGIPDAAPDDSFEGDSIMRADEWVREDERESKLVDALYKARYLISMHNGMTVRCDGEEWALDFGQELKMIDATLKMAGIDTRRLKQ